MGASFSQNQVKQAIDQITDIVTNETSNSMMTSEQIQSLSCTNEKGDVIISNIDLNQKQLVDTQQLITNINDDRVEQKSSAQLKQVAQAITKGINFANVAVANNTANQMIDDSVKIAHSMQTSCSNSINQFMSINGSAAGPVCNISNIRMTQSQGLTTKCVANMANTSSVIQSAQEIADQTAIAKTEGLDIMGALLGFILLILVVPIVLKSKGGGGGGGGGSEKGKTANIILGVLGGLTLLPGIIMTSVGDKQTVTLYGFVDPQDMCGTASGVLKEKVKDVGIGGASDICIQMNETAPGSCDGFFYDKGTEQMTVYTKIPYKPCAGMLTLMTDPDADAGKKWAGFVQTPHKIRNIGIGLICGGTVCFIMLAVFMFLQARRPQTSTTTTTTAPRS